MSDLIDRQAAIEAVEQIRYRIWEVDIPSPTVPEYIEHHEQMQELLARCDSLRRQIEDLPPVQPEPKWMPCSEELPIIGQDVVFSVGDMYAAEGCLRDDGDWCQFRWNTIQSSSVVTAWMPLPEPYKGEQE